MQALHAPLAISLPSLQPLHLATALWSYAVIGVRQGWMDELLQQVGGPVSEWVGGSVVGDRWGGWVCWAGVPAVSCGEQAACDRLSTVPMPCLPLLSALTPSIGVSAQVAEQELAASRLKAYSTKELTSLLFAYGRLLRCLACAPFHLQLRP